MLYVTFWDSRSHSLERLKNHALIAVDSTGDDYFSVDYDQESGKCTVNRFD